MKCFAAKRKQCWKNLTFPFSKLKELSACNSSLSTALQPKDTVPSDNVAQPFGWAHLLDLIPDDLTKDICPDEPWAQPCLLAFSLPVANFPVVCWQYFMLQTMSGRDYSQDVVTWLVQTPAGEDVQIDKPQQDLKNLVVLKSWVDGSRPVYALNFLVLWRYNYCSATPGMS